jgi:3',5'-cyclic AMP phosphodiesterase CpdA
VRIAPERSWDLWSAYLAGLSPEAVAPAIGSSLTSPRSGVSAPRHADYPTLRIRGRLAMIGLCSAIPTPIFRAGGQLGAEQLARLERLLIALRDGGFCRVIMIHHPVAVHQEPERRALWDGDAFRAVLARAGAELVLHGHKHRRRVAMLPGPDVAIPVIGVPSSSEVGSRPEKRAQYHLYTLRGGESRQAFRIDGEVRGYDPQSREFLRVDEPLL